MDQPSKEHRLVKTHSLDFKYGDFYVILLTRNILDSLISRIEYSCFKRPYQKDRYGLPFKLHGKEFKLVESNPKTLDEAILNSIKIGLMEDYYKDFIGYNKVVYNQKIYYEDLLYNSKAAVSGVEEDLRCKIDTSIFKIPPQKDISNDTLKKIKNYLNTVQANLSNL